MSKIIQKKFKLIKNLDCNFSFLLQEYNFELCQYVYDGYRFGSESMDLVGNGITIKFLIDKEKDIVIKFSGKDKSKFYYLKEFLRYLNNNSKIQYTEEDMRTLIIKIIDLFKNKEEFRKFDHYSSVNNDEWIKDNFSNLHNRSSSAQDKKVTKAASSLYQQPRTTLKNSKLSDKFHNKESDTSS